jgi:uncharacterized membrane protein HdeD (DUF308 family)
MEESKPTLEYAFLLSGVTALTFGLILIFRQDQALALLMVLLGLWWLIHGAFLVVAFFVDRSDLAWKLGVGGLGLAAGILVLLSPGDAADAFRGGVGAFLGVIGILVGIASVLGAMRGGGSEAVAFGAVSILIGALILLNAQFSTTVLITLFGGLLVLDGVVALGLTLRSAR